MTTERPKHKKGPARSNTMVLVPPDFETYRKYSRALMDILSGYTSLLQQVSIDEAYLAGQTVTFQIKTSEFERHSRQMSLPDLTDQSKDIESAALLLADQLLGGPEGLFAQEIRIRLIGVGVSRLAEKKVHQMDLFEWAERNEEAEAQKAEREKQAQAKKARQAKLDAMMSKVNERYGKGTIRKGKTQGSNDPG